MENKDIIKKLFELGVGSGDEARHLFETKIINESECSVAHKLRMFGGSMAHDNDMSMNPAGPLLYPKWCYDELEYGINKFEKWKK